MKNFFSPTALRAVALISGGLDSSLAVKVVQRLGVRVYALHCVLPWLPGPNPIVTQTALHLGVPLKIHVCDREFLQMVQQPPHGYGVQKNPCIDCHLYQLRKAKDLMQEIGADFVCTGEVLGQRPMSQNRHQLLQIEEKSGLKGRLLRPLSARLLPETLLEQDGRINRDQLHAISGRSRTDLIALAKQFDLTTYIPTGGGCLLADANFARRLEDIFIHGYCDRNDLITLAVGRHFRIDATHKIIVGRDERENALLLDHAQSEDFIFQLDENDSGPIVLLKSLQPSSEILQQCANLLVYFTKFRSQEKVVLSWLKRDPGNRREILSQVITQDAVEALRI